MNSLRIRVATYNVHKCKGLDRRTRVDRIVAVIRQLNADVVALQEVLAVDDERYEYDQVRRITRELKEYRFCFGENRRLYGGAYGNLTLSRFPIKVCQNYDLTWHKRERRGCLRSDISLSDRAVLHVFNVHLGTGFVERRHQAQRLLSSEVLNRSELISPRMIVGDFNEWVKGLASRLMSNAFDVAEPRAFLQYARTYPGLFPFLHLDHFYFDAQLSLRSFRMHRSPKALISSDHLPIVAEFEVAL